MGTVKDVNDAMVAEKERLRAIAKTGKHFPVYCPEGDEVRARLDVVGEVLGMGVTDLARYLLESVAFGKSDILDTFADAYEKGKEEYAKQQEEARQTRIQVETICAANGLDSNSPEGISFAMTVIRALRRAKEKAANS